MTVEVDDKVRRRGEAEFTRTFRREKRPCERITWPDPFRPRRAEHGQLAAGSGQYQSCDRSSKDGSESNPLFRPSPAHTAVDATRAPSAPWSNALVADMVIVDSVCVLALP